MKRFKLAWKLISDCDAKKKKKIQTKNIYVCGPHLVTVPVYDTGYKSACMEDFTE